MKGKHPVAMLCELLEVSRSGYYRWQESPPTVRQRQDDELADKIVQAHAKSRKNYGAPRIVKELKAAGIKTSKRRCARIMREHGVQGRKKHRRRPRTTDSRHAHPPAPNLMRATIVTGPKQAWMTDITYLSTGEGWLYLAAILDAWSRRVVGWAAGPTLHVSLVLAALAQARRNRQPPAGLLHHSDQGVQYACGLYRDALAAAQMVCSMSRRGNCYDNAYMESFFASLKLEMSDFQSAPDGVNKIRDYILFYNTTRRHSSLAYCTYAI